MTDTTVTPAPADLELTDTQKSVLEQLTENTGTHFLDSGGAYGRHWSTNQALGAETLAQAPESTVSWKYGLDVTHHLATWLPERVERDDTIAALDEVFVQWATAETGEVESYRYGAPAIVKRADVPWLQSAQDFVALLGSARGIYGDGEPFVVNTYNGEDLLSQVLQYVYFTLEREVVLISTPLPDGSGIDLTLASDREVSVCSYCEKHIVQNRPATGHLWAVAGVEVEDVEPDEDDLSWAREDAGSSATEDEVYEIAARRATEAAVERATRCDGTGSNGEHEEADDPQFVLTEGESTVEFPSGEYVLLQVHGGADVRGGYTRPRLYRVWLEDGPSLFDNAKAHLYCDNDACTDQYGQNSRWETDDAYTYYSEAHANLDTYERVEVDFSDEEDENRALALDPAERVGKLVVDTDADVAYCPACGVSTLKVAAY